VNNAILSFIVGDLIKVLFEDRDNFDWVYILGLKFLMMAATLKCISSSDEVCHFSIELIASPFFFRFHDLFVKVDEGDILHVFLITPLARTLARYVLSAAAPLDLVSYNTVFDRLFQQ
jgi:hypothetical protein